MTRRLTFAFLREGTSDDGLVKHLETLVVEAGAAHASGTVLRFQGPIVRKLECLRTSGEHFDLVFVHKDSDDSDPSRVRNEITSAFKALDLAVPGVCVVPVQELEAWLLCDEMAIREVAGFPGGKSRIDMPKLGQIETTRSPKEVLKKAYVDAADLRGARLRKHTNRFSMRRSALLERLDVHGPITCLSSWQQLVSDVNDAVGRALQSPHV